MHWKYGTSDPKTGLYINRDAAGPLPQVYNPLIYTPPESHYLPCFPYMVDLQLCVLLGLPFIPTPTFRRLLNYICYQNCCNL